MDRRFLSPLLVVALLATTAGVSFARAIPRDPADYALDMARWHLAHQRERKALTFIASEFPTVISALATTRDKLTVEQRLQIASGEEDRWLADQALGTALAAVLYSEGRYAVSQRAPKQGRAGREQTLAVAQSILEHLRTQRSGQFQDEVWSEYSWQVEARVSQSLVQGEYDQAVGDLVHAHPGMEQLLQARDAASYRSLLEKAPERVQRAMPLLLAAVLRSDGKAGKRVVGGASETATADSHKANLAWAVMAVEVDDFKSADLKADALWVQPQKRDEYVQFVLRAATDRDFDSVWGWQHVQRATEAMQDIAREEIEYRMDMEKREKPSKTQPENTCG